MMLLQGLIPGPELQAADPRVYLPDALFPQQKAIILPEAKSAKSEELAMNPAPILPLAARAMPGTSYGPVKPRRR